MPMKIDQAPESVVRLTDRVYYLPHFEPTDRPILGYVRGDRYSLASDAGASPAHVSNFYRALDAEGLPHPTYTVLTHWHWDHAFGMSCVEGATVASCATNELLAEEARLSAIDETYWDGMRRETRGFADEYPIGSIPTIVQSDIQFEDTLTFDLGGVEVRLFRSVAPHTDDSVLVHIPQERVVFLGDSVYGMCDEQGEHSVDRTKLEVLAATVRGLDCEWFAQGHWEPLDAVGIEEDLDPVEEQ